MVVHSRTRKKGNAINKMIGDFGAPMCFVLVLVSLPLRLPPPLLHSLSPSRPTLLPFPLALLISPSLPPSIPPSPISRLPLHLTLSSPLRHPTPLDPRDTLRMAGLALNFLLGSSSLSYTVSSVCPHSGLSIHLFPSQRLWTIHAKLSQASTLQLNLRLGP